MHVYFFLDKFEVASFFYYILPCSANMKFSGVQERKDHLFRREEFYFESLKKPHTTPTEYTLFCEGGVLCQKCYVCISR